MHGYLDFKSGHFVPRTLIRNPAIILARYGRVDKGELESMRNFGSRPSTRREIVDESARCEARPESKPASSQPHDNSSTMPNTGWLSMIDSSRRDSREMRNIHRAVYTARARAFARTRDSFMLLPRCRGNRNFDTRISIVSRRRSLPRVHSFLNSAPRVICTSAR